MGIRDAVKDKAKEKLGLKSKGEGTVEASPAPSAPPAEPAGFEREVIEDKEATGCSGTVIEVEPGFKISGLVSKGENFFGVNLTESSTAWDAFYILWEVEVWGYEAGRRVPIGMDSRAMTIGALRGCGSLGTFYPPHRSELVLPKHACRLKVKVSKEALAAPGRVGG